MYMKTKDRNFLALQSGTQNSINHFRMNDIRCYGSNVNENK